MNESGRRLRTLIVICTRILLYVCTSVFHRVVNVKKTFAILGVVVAPRIFLLRLTLMCWSVIINESIVRPDN
jgi:hypothetical protein